MALNNFRASVFRHAVETPREEPIETLSVVIGASSAQTGAISAQASDNGQTVYRKVRFHAELACFVMWGVNPDAGDPRAVPVGPENPEYFDVLVGHKIAVKERT